MGGVIIEVPGWQEPKTIETELLAVESFNLKLLPASLREWVLDASYRMDKSPADYMSVAILVALGSLIGDKATIRPKENDDWVVVPNLWGVIVGRPSAKKSPALKAACSAIEALDEESALTFNQESENYVRQLDFYKVEMAVAKKNASTKLSAGNRDEAEEAFISSSENDPALPIRRRRLTNNTSIEKLGEIQRDNPHGILVFRDELTGFLQSLDRKDHGSDRALYLEGWSGLSSFTNDTIGRGTTHTPKNIVSILGGIQPGKLMKYLSARQSGEGDDGLLERFQLMVYPDSGIPERIDKAPDKRSQDQAHKVFLLMDNIEPGEEYRFAAEAQEVFNCWYDDNLRKCTECSDVHVESLLGKYPSLVASLALIIHLCDSGAGKPVSLNAVTMAAGWAEYLESHAQRINGLMNNPALLAKNLVDHLKDLNNPFTAREINQKGWKGLGSYSDTTQALDYLCATGHIKLKRDELTGGRPSDKYFINPRLS